MIDTGDGVNRVYKTPRTTTGFPADFSIPNPQWTYLAGRPGQLRVGRVRLGVLQLHRQVGRDVLGALRRGHARADHAHAAGLHSGRARQRSRHRAEAQGDLGCDAAKVHRALAADGQGHAVRRREPRLPQRRLQSVGRRARGRRGRQEHVRRADRGHGRGRHQDAAQQQPDQLERRGVRHRSHGRVLLHLPRRVEHAEPRAASTSRTTRASSSSSTRS